MNHLIILVWILSPFLFLEKGLENPDPQLLIGNWELDMSPQNQTDDNFAIMRIEKIEGNRFEGIFYREGVLIEEGQLNLQTGKIYAALVSRDGTGQYHTAFYYEDGLLYGSTHAIDRKFLSVWTAKKLNK